METLVRCIGSFYLIREREDPEVSKLLLGHIDYYLKTNKALEIATLQSSLWNLVEGWTPAKTLFWGRFFLLPLSPPPHTHCYFPRNTYTIICAIILS